MKLYSYYTPSHEVFFKNFLLPTAKREYQLVSHQEEYQFCPSANFESNGWRETQYNKVLFWIEAIQDNMGELILCTDADIQFLGPTKSVLKATMGRNDLLFQKNNISGHICSGFFVCRCSYKTLNIFEIIAKRLKSIMHIDGGGEQYVMQDLFKEGWHGLKIGMLDRSKFWCPGKTYEDISSLNIPSEILMHHANWTVGIDNKIKQLEHVKSFALQNSSPYQPLHLKSNKLDKNNVKIAICLSSLLRDFDVFSISLVCRVLKSLPVKPDLICHFPKCSNSKFNKNIIDSLSPYVNDFFIEFEDDPILPDSHLSMSTNMAFQRSGIKGNLLQWHSLKKCSIILKNAHEKKDYDWVIWSRPDLYFFNNLDNIPNLDNRYYYTSAHDNHLQGINDRFCLGNFQDVYNRMNIYDYFVKEWYPKYHNNKRYLTFNKSTESHCWNPELVLKHFLMKKLKLKTKKLDLCFGKIRNKFYVTTPFWHSVYSTRLSSSECKDDIVNHYVLDIIDKLPQFKQYEESPWPLVKILDDTIMFNHPDRIKENFHNIPIDSETTFYTKKGFINSLLTKLQLKSMSIK